jgi:hypothetical protein
MPKLLPDQTFYPSPTMAMQAPAETLEYVALLNPDPTGHDALAVLDVDPPRRRHRARWQRIRGVRRHASAQVHLQGGDASSDSYCFS